MATLHVRFFDDLQGTTPKITTFPIHASTQTPLLVTNQNDVTASKIMKGTP